MAKCEVIDLTPSSDSDFIQVTCQFLYVPHLFLHQVSVHQVSIRSSSCYNGNYFTGLVHVVVMYTVVPQSKADSFVLREAASRC